MEPNQLATLAVRAVMSAPVAALTASMTVAGALRLLASAPATSAAVVVGAKHSSAANGANGSNGSNGSHVLAASDDGGGGISWPRTQWTFPVVDDTGDLVGIVSRGDLLDAAGDESKLTQPLSAIAKTDLVVATPEEPMVDALARLVAGDFALLPVVEAPGSRRIVGAFSRSAALRASQALEEGIARRERYIGGKRATPELVASGRAD
jgi:CBS domain-containing protein